MSFHSCSSPSSHAQMISDGDVFADYHLPGNEQPPDRVHTLPTFKLVSDNLDKVYAHVICELTARSKHFTFSCVLCVIIPMWLSSQTTHLSLKTILLTTQDQEMLQKNVMLIACILTKHMPLFKKFGSGLEHHLIHEQYEEMSAKSEVVSIYITTEMARTEAIDLLTYCKTKDVSNDCQAKGHPI